MNASAPDPASIATDPWLVPPVLRYVAGRGDRVFVLLSGFEPATGHSTCALVRSDDAGLTWGAPTVIASSLGSSPAHPNMRWFAHAIALDAADADTIYVTLESQAASTRGLHLAVSTDGGATFSRLELPCAGYEPFESFADVASGAPEAAQGALLDADGRGRVRLFYLSANGIHFRTSIDGGPFGEEHTAVAAQRMAWGNLTVARAGEKTALLWQSKSSFDAAAPLLFVSTGADSAFEPRALPIGDDAKSRLGLRIASPAAPCMIRGSSGENVSLSFSRDAAESFSTLTLEGPRYRAYQAHDTGRGIVAITRSPIHPDDDSDTPAEPCVALRIGFGSEAAVERVDVCPASAPRSSFDAWLGTRSSYVLQRGEELDEESTQISRIGGPAIGIREWPEADGVPLQHILTIDLRRQREDGHPGTAAVALFAALCDDFGQAMYQVVELSDEDLVDPTPTPFPGDEVDARLAVASELVLEEPTEWADSFCGGYAGYIQGTDLRPSASEEDLVGHAALLDASGPFLLRFGESLFPEFDFGDGGIVYVHRRNAWLEMS